MTATVIVELPVETENSGDSLLQGVKKSLAPGRRSVPGTRMSNGTGKGIRDIKDSQHSSKELSMSKMRTTVHLGTIGVYSRWTPMGLDGITGSLRPGRMNRNRPHSHQ